MRPLFIVVAIASVLGALFSAVSTSDFIQHLDRQVHSIHCSFIPGAGRELGDSGCRTVMMSPYSSFFREHLWGGVPVALWALAVFSFLAYRASVLAFRGRATRAEASFLLLATGLPLGMSAIYGFLSAVEVGATCRVCVGMYGASIAAFVVALMAQRRVAQSPHEGLSGSRFVPWFFEGVGFVLALTVVFLMFRPASASAKGDEGCGTLVRGDDPSGIMLELSSRGKVPAIEVLDPLCPSCRAFDTRLGASGLGRKLALKGVLFPLDSSCNWMVTEKLHPGACAVSEAILCANGLGATHDSAAALRVLEWAFKNQEKLRQEAAGDEAVLRRHLESQFPAVKGCLGGHQVKNKLTKSLRWAVANAVPVLTPQLFIGDRRMCDENTDLGLEYTLKRMLSAKPASTKEARR